MSTAVAVAVDVVLLSLHPDDGLVVLTARREREPFAGAHTLPGAALTDGEDLKAAARRILATVPGLTPPQHLEQLATFGAPDRDPRGRVVSVAYLALLPAPPPVDAPASWSPAAAPAELGFDHTRIVATAVARLRGKLAYSNVAYGLLPPAFTLTELQAVYELVLGRALDKRNFRKKVAALPLLVETEEQRRGSHRPAQLYRFTQPRLVLLDDVVT